MPRYLLPLVFMMASFTGHAVADSAAERLAQAKAMDRDEVIQAALHPGS